MIDPTVAPVLLSVLRLLFQLVCLGTFLCNCLIFIFCHVADYLATEYSLPKNTPKKQNLLKGGGRGRELFFMGFFLGKILGPDIKF